MNMFFLFKNDKVNVPNLSIHIELLGCTDAQLFCDFCNEHIYTQSTEYNNIHLQPCRVFITLFKKVKYVKQINGKLVVVPDKDGNPISLKHIFKQSKQIVYKTPLTLSQTNQEEYYNSYVYSDLNWHHTHASL